VVGVTDLSRWETDPDDVSNDAVRGPLGDADLGREVTA